MAKKTKQETIDALKYGVDEAIIDLSDAIRIAYEKGSDSQSNFSLSSITKKKGYIEPDERFGKTLPWNNNCDEDTCECDDEFDDKVREIVQDEILFAIKEVFRSKDADEYEDALDKWESKQ